MADDFHVVYEAFKEDRLKHATGHRERRLAEGLGFAEKLFLEKVWWPALGSSSIYSRSMG